MAAENAYADIAAQLRRQTRKNINGHFHCPGSKNKRKADWLA